jgi:hypothetical protein
LIVIHGEPEEPGLRISCVMGESFEEIDQLIRAQNDLLYIALEDAG